METDPAVLPPTYDTDDVSLKSTFDDWFRVFAPHVDYSRCRLAARHSLGAGLPLCTSRCRSCKALALDADALKPTRTRTCMVCGTSWTEVQPGVANPLFALGPSLVAGKLYLARVPG